MQALQPPFWCAEQRWGRHRHAVHLEAPYRTAPLQVYGSHTARRLRPYTRSPIAAAAAAAAADAAAAVADAAAAAADAAAAAAAVHTRRHTVEAHAAAVHPALPDHLKAGPLMRYF